MEKDLEHVKQMLRQMNTCEECVEYNAQRVIAEPAFLRALTECTQKETDAEI